MGLFNRPRLKDFSYESIYLFGIVLTFGAIEYIRSLYGFLQTTSANYIIFVLGVIFVVFSHPLINKIFKHREGFANKFADNGVKRIGLTLAFSALIDFGFVRELYTSSPILSWVLGVVIMTLTPDIIKWIFKG